MNYLRWIIAAIAISALTAEVARADMGYVSPVNIHMRFDNLDDFPEYDFYLKYGLGQGNPLCDLHLTKINSATLTKLEGEGRRLSEVYLLAVPRGQVVSSPPKWPHDDSWWNNWPKGAIHSSPLMWRDSPHLDNHHGCSAFYRVSIENKQLTATWIGGVEPPRSSWNFDVFDWAAFAGVALSVMIAVIGLLWIRRRRRRLKA